MIFTTLTRDTNKRFAGDADIDIKSTNHQLKVHSHRAKAIFSLIFVAALWSVYIYNVLA